MGTKIDWLDDPNAPEANSLVPAANALVVNEAGEILLIQRSDNGLWALPGGAMDLGETIEETAVRETLEETAVDIEITGLVGIYTDPAHRIEYTSNGEVRQEFAVVFSAKPIGGSATTSDEAKQAAWVAPDDIDSLSMHPSMKLRIQHHLEDVTPHLG